jgi:hypothetical protein
LLDTMVVRPILVPSFLVLLEGRKNKDEKMDQRPMDGSKNGHGSKMREEAAHYTWAARTFPG